MTLGGSAGIHRERRLRARLRRHDGPDVAVNGAPWQLVTSDAALAEEEPVPPGVKRA